MSMENGKWSKKPCNRCKRLLPLEDFYYIKSRQKESNFCRRCHIKEIQIRNSNNKENLKIYKHNYYEQRKQNHS